MKLSVLCVSIACLFLMVSVCAQAQLNGCNCNEVAWFAGGNPPHVTTGNYNSGLGLNVLNSDTTGYYNSGFGYGALYFNTAGWENTATGFTALKLNTTGNDNTADGFQALLNNVTGSLNTALGYNAGPDSASANLTNATAIGANAIVSESNALVLGGSGGNAVKVGIGTATPANVFTVAQGAGPAIADGWDTYSSRRWKTNIQTLHGALAKVGQLRGVSYDLKDSGKHEVGVIAEEVGAVVPEIVSWGKDGKDAQGVDYGRLTALLIEATKEQEAQIRQQQELIARLRSQVKAIQASIVMNGRSGSRVRTVKSVQKLTAQ